MKKTLFSLLLSLSVFSCSIPSYAENLSYQEDAMVSKLATILGTEESDISNSITEINNGYDSSCNGVYVWTFAGQVKNEISAGRPVILNIARGYYGNHSVTVAGYSVYKTNKTDYQFIKIVDGWSAGYRYIDYKAFAFDLASSGFGSFNTATVK